MTAIKYDYGYLVWAPLADCLSECGRNEEAMDAYAKAIESNPTDCNTYFMRSNLKAKMRDIDGQIADLEKAISLAKIESHLNNLYHEAAKKIGWSNGNSFLYEQMLVMAKMDKKQNESIIASRCSPKSGASKVR